MRTSRQLPAAVTLLLLLLSWGCGPARREDPPPARAADLADVVLTGGRIVTLDPQYPRGEAVAIRNGRILVVGSDRHVSGLVGPNTEVIHLEGRTVIPGIIETHCHPLGVARALLKQQWEELRSIPEIQAWIRGRARELPRGQWIFVPRTDITRLPERRHPTPAELDAASTTHPVFFKAVRKHVFNTTGFERVGITRETGSVAGVRILRDEGGNPVLLAGADRYLRDRIPSQPIPDSRVIPSLLQVLEAYNRVGITSIFDRAANVEGYRLWEKLRDEGKLTVRTTVTFRSQFRDGEAVKHYVDQLELAPGDGDSWVKPGPLKITVDGGIHWGTTRLREPYGEVRTRFYRLEDSSYRGELNFSVERMTDIFATAHELGWQMSCHVTGDAGVDRVLDALEAVHGKVDIRERRFNLIHAYFPAEDMIRRARNLGVCVDTQCYLYFRDSDAMAEIYGPTWAERFIGIGSWLDGGVPVAINSDHMIGLDPDHSMNSFNPFLQMYIAVSRKNENGRVYGPHQRISRIDALRCMTRNAAYLSFDEDRLGSLEPGKLADLAVLDRDFLSCSEEEIREIQVVLTMVDGKIVHERPREE